ncbi:Hypothetical predicted protein, partial [Pelobates cultripes]
NGRRSRLQQNGRRDLAHAQKVQTAVRISRQCARSKMAAVRAQGRWRRTPQPKSPGKTGAKYADRNPDQ